MNFIAALFISTFLFLSPPKSTSIDPLIEDNMKYYCNPRFDFCVEYPAKLFTKKVTPTNADGIFLSDENNKITLALYGEYNIFNSDLKGQHKFLLDALSDTDGTIIDHLTIYGDDSFVSNIEFENHMLELRCQKVDNYFVTAIIRLKEKTNSILSNSKKDIKIKIITS